MKKLRLSSPAGVKAPEVLSAKQMLRKLGNKVEKFQDGGSVSSNLLPHVQQYADIAKEALAGFRGEAVNPEIAQGLRRMRQRALAQQAAQQSPPPVAIAPSPAPVVPSPVVTPAPAPEPAPAPVTSYPRVFTPKGEYLPTEENRWWFENLKKATDQQASKPPPAQVAPPPPAQVAPPPPAQVTTPVEPVAPPPPSVPVPRVPTPLFGSRTAASDADFFALQPSAPRLPGLTPGTVGLPYNPFEYIRGPSALDLLRSSPNLSPLMLGGLSNVGYRTDRFGNIIMDPGRNAIRAFSEGGFAENLAKVNEVNEFNVSQEDEEPIGVSRQMLQGVPQKRVDYSVSPTGASVRKTSQTTMQSPSGAAKGMKFELEQLSASKMPGVEGKLGESVKSQMEALAEEYRLKRNAAIESSRGLLQSTLSRPTLERPLLSKRGLTKKRFKEGGEVREDKEEVLDKGSEDRRPSGIELIGGSRSTPGLPEPMDIRSDMLGFIKRMDDASLMATASKMTGMPFSSPTQARVMLEKMLGDDAAISAGLIGMGRNLPERVVGYSVGARMPAFGGQLNVGADIPRGPGSPMFNLGYTKQFQAGGAVTKRNRPVKGLPSQPAQGTQLDSANTFGSEDAFEFTPAGTRNRMTRFIKSSAGDASDPQITRSRDEFDRLARASKQEPLPPNVGGMFDAFVGPRGAIFVSPLGGPATFTHEMAHAADYNMGKLYRQASAAKEQKSNPAAQQFAEAYEKLIGKTPSQEKRAEGARALATEWFDELEKQKAYRNYPPELTAFAMENAIGGDRGQLTPQRAPLHVDPTLATEFTLLTDLAQKYVDSRTNKPR